MATPQDELDQCTPLFETCGSPDIVRETMNARRLVRGPLLWDTIIDFVGSETQLKSGDQIFNSTGEDHWVKRWDDILQSLDWLCEESLKEFDGSGFGHEFSLDSLKEELICLHREGSFNVQSPGAVARCLHLACVICLNCTLLCLRIDLQSKDPTLVTVGYSGLTDDYLSGLSNKWSAKSNSDFFNQWTRYLSTDSSEDSKEATKLLYQWTILPLQVVLRKLERVMDGVSNDNLAEINRVSRWGVEICDFLEDCRPLFTCDDFEFLYDIIFRVYHRTALLQLSMGNVKRATKLDQTLENMLEDILNDRDNLMITEWETGKITYINPDPGKIIDRMMKVCKDPEKRFKLREEGERIENEHGLASEVKSCRFFGWNTFPYGPQINYIILALGHERFGEAREHFEQVVLKDKELKASFFDFLQGALTDRNLPHFIAHSCLKSPLKWESVREKQDFFLHVCEALGYRQLTAKYLQSFGFQIALHSFDKFAECIEDAPKLKILLKEELNLLQLPSLAPKYVHVLKSCLSDPCQSDEHKRDDLPDMLKAYRLMKRSIDIYSDLLHNWSQRSSNEVEWLQLLESQKSTHERLLTFLLVVCTICYKTLMKSNNSSEDANNHLVPYSERELSALKRAFFELSSITLVWTERSRARTLLNQLGPWYNYIKQRDGNPGSLKEELYEFDNNQEAALSSILSCRFACKGKPLFVEYVSQTHINTHSSYMNRNNALAYLIHVEVEVMEGVMFHFNGDKVEKLVNDFYKTVDEFQRSKPRRHDLDADFVLKLHRVLEELHDVLIEPLLNRHLFKHLDPEATLIFVPDKMLYRVPFALLRNKKTQKHLYQLHPIAVAPSLRVLQHCERRLRDLEKSPLKSEGCILAVGNAAYEKNSLPGTAVELEHLRSCFPSRVMTLEKDKATRAKFLELVKEASHSTEQRVFACIHLGVHGHWRRDEPTGEEEKQYKTGSLQFAKPPKHTGGSEGPMTDSNSSDRGINRSLTSGPEQHFTSDVATISSNGERYRSAFGEVGAVMRAEGYSSTAEEDMLPSEDIIKGGFQWPTRLVVLSACNSSRGQDYTDGEVNLPRALMIAGVPAAIVSQWKVDDSASPALMKAFYENLQCGQDVATALQSSMIQLSNSDSENANNIFEWGPFLVWGLPTVEFPKELWTENARKTFPARQLAKALILPLNSIKSRMDNSDKPNSTKVSLLNALKTVKSFLDLATYNARALEMEAIRSVIVAIELLVTLSCQTDHFPEDAIDLAEKVYALLPSNLLKQVDTEFIFTHFRDQLQKSGGVDFDKGPRDFEAFKILFGRRIMFTQAMKGSHQIALEYANKMIEVIQNAYRCEYDESRVQIFREDEKLVRQERAVILRLMGNNEEARREFDDILALGENYDCLIQMSYLKYLMQDKSGALQYGRRAKILAFHSPSYRPGRGAFLLGLKALPYEYREWLSSALFSVRILPAGELPKEVSMENTRKDLHAKHLVELLRPKLDDVAELWRCSWDETVVDDKKVKLSTQLNIVKNFLESASGSTGCMFQDEDIVLVVDATDRLMMELSPLPLVSKDIIELTEDVYAIFPLDQLQRLELLVKDDYLFKFRQRIMYIQAMKGNYETALEYANKMIEAMQNAYECGCQESGTQASRAQEEFVRLERAVILRLMGRYDEALKEFDDKLAFGENYECLIQTSYLKHLMGDKRGALEYACRAKNLQESPTLSGLGYGTFCLCFSALPDEYRRWLLNGDEVTGASLSSLRGLPTVQLPKELWTENTRKALAAKPRVVALKWKFKCRKHKEDNMGFVNALNAVVTFLESVYNACAFEEAVIVNVIIAIESLLAFTRRCNFFEEVIAVAEDVYTVLPLEQLQSVEIESISTQFWDQLHLFTSLDRYDKREACQVFTIEFRKHVMYTQALKGNHQIALDYVNKTIDDIQNTYGDGYDKSNIMQGFKVDEMIARVERAVILRLMGNYEEARREFDGILALGENYECLIQTSYLKDLMGDKSGALEFARRAKIIQPCYAELDRPGRDAFCLCFSALPDEYRRWLLNVDGDSAGPSSPSVWGSNSDQLPKEVCVENARAAHPVRQEAELPSCPTDRTQDNNVKL